MGWLKGIAIRRAGARALLGALVMVAGSRAEAATSCTVSAVGVAFGTYDPQSSTAKTGTGSITATCSGGSTVLSATLGTGQSGTYSARTMKAGSFTLNYNLYTSSTYGTVWGNGSAGTAARSLPSAGTYTVYGRITALQNVGAGSYTDSIAVTLTF